MDELQRIVQDVLIDYREQLQNRWHEGLNDLSFRMAGLEDLGALDFIEVESLESEYAGILVEKVENYIHGELDE